MEQPEVEVFGTHPVEGGGDVDGDRFRVDPGSGPVGWAGMAPLPDEGDGVPYTPIGHPSAQASITGAVRVRIGQSRIEGVDSRAVYLVEESPRFGNQHRAEQRCRPLDHGRAVQPLPGVSDPPHHWSPSSPG